jgi:hypothetical protein
MESNPARLCFQVQEANKYSPDCVTMLCKKFQRQLVRRTEPGAANPLQTSETLGVSKKDRKMAIRHGGNLSLS